MTRNFLKPEEYDVVVSRASGVGRNTGYRARNAMCVLLGLHGLRVGEVCALNVGDLEQGRRAIHVETSKKGKKRDIRMDKDFFAWLSLFAEDKSPDEPLFCTSSGKRINESHLRRAWRRLSRQWINRKVNFHALRHTAAQRLYDGTGDIYRVQRFLGHRRVSTTQIYAEASIDNLEFLPHPPEPEVFEVRLAALG